MSTPASLSHASQRLSFPPSYVIVGVYRLFTDKTLYIPIWAKCQHGVFRGLAVGLGWALVSFNLQKEFVKLFLINSPRVTGLSHDSVFGFKIPFSLPVYATLLFLGSQITIILKFFLAKNMRIARTRAWDQTVASRGKGAEFWGPYVEEWEKPPAITPWTWQKWVGGTFGPIVARVALMPLNFYPFVGIAVAAYFKSINIARWLHRPYFEAKRMTPEQVAIFMEERKWDYRAFGFVAALLEGLPIIGLMFSVSNRIGAAMWAHDLEKRQHAFASGELRPLPPRITKLAEGEEVEVRPRRTEMGSALGDSTTSAEQSFVGSWVDVTDNDS